MNTKKLFITVRNVKRIRKKVTKIVPYNGGVVRVDRDMGESCCCSHGLHNDVLVNDVPQMQWWYLT